MADPWLSRSRACSTVLAALSAVYVASELACEGQREKIGAQLRDLGEELVYLHRQLLELPPQRTPAACEFERAELDGGEVPF